MVANYIKLAFRLLSRNLFSTVVNLSGLSVGLAMFFLLWQYAQTELRSDQFHDGADRIVRFGNLYRFAGENGETKTGKLSVNEPELARSVAREFPEIQSYTRIFAQANFSKDHVPAHEKDLFLTYIDDHDRPHAFAEKNLVYADANLFTFFTFPLAQGDAASVLTEPYTVALSATNARKYFGNDEAIGKTLLLNDTTPLKVTGVFKDLPHNTHLSFDIAISAATLENSISTIHITNGGPFCYFKLEPGTDLAALEQKVKAFSHQHFTRLLKNTCATCDAEAYLQPLRELPFNSGDWFDTSKPKSRYLLVALSTIAVLILVMAWINYINMAVSANLKRIKELAARKTVGARYGDFIAQFTWESFLINLLAAVLAFVIIQTVRTPAETLLQFYIPDLYDTPPFTLAIMAAALIFGTLFTGIYPAVITLRANPRVLFGTFKALKKGNTFTQVLTTLQFSFAVILITWIFSIHLQLEYILSKDLGIRKDQVVTIDLPLVYTHVSEGALHAFAEEVSKIPGVSGRTVSHSIPGIESKFLGVERNGKWITAQSNGAVDEDFIPLYHIRMIAGRNFQKDNPADQQSILLSQTAAAQLGIGNPTDAIGQTISVQKSDWSPESVRATIVGVFEDYKVDPLFSSVNNRDGIVLVYKNYLLPANITPRKISLLVSTADIQGTLQQVGDLYNTTFAGQVFNWNFLDQQIGRFYEQEKTTRNQITLFTLLAIGIACLGLLAMIRNKALEKTKEMGVRKVLGAGFHHLTALLLNTTARQVMIATVIGIPAAVMLTQRYLEKFSDRIALQWWHYALPAAILIAVMLLTVASTLFKVNKTNPVDALRYE